MAKQFININLDELKQYYLEGASLHQLAKQYNTSRATIRKKLLKAGTKILSSKERIASNPELHRKSSNPKLQFDESLILVLADHYSISEISKRVNTNPDTISRILQRHNKTPVLYNISNNMKKLAEKTRPQWDNKENLYDLYINKNKSCGDIANIYGYHRETIRVKLMNYGIKLRRLDEASSIAANTPKGKKARSKISKEAWKNSEFRNNIIQKLTGSHPIMPPKHSKNVSRAMKKLYTDPQFLHKHKERIKKLWEKPTPAMLKNLHETHIKLREDTEIRRKFINIMQSDEKREQLSANALIQWSDAIFLKYQLPIIRKKCSRAAKEAWKDPNYRNKILKAMSNRTESKLEKTIYGILDDIGIDHHKIRLGRSSFEFDIHISKEQLNQDRGLLIEVNGLYVHTRPKQIKRDEDRKQYWHKYLSDQYRYEIIWEYDFGAYKTLFPKLIKILNITPKPRQINLTDLLIKKIDSESAEIFLNKYHYLAKHRQGYHIGAFHNDNLIACCSFSGITRLESAQKQGLKHQQVRQLSRFCISPLYNNKNLASFFLSRAINIYRKHRPKTQMLITFADQTAGHIGTIYSATNWKLDGITKPSYFYEKKGFRWHKKTIWDYARSMGTTESEFTTMFDIKKINTLSKYRYIYHLK